MSENTRFAEVKDRWGALSSLRRCDRRCGCSFMARDALRNLPSKGRDGGGSFYTMLWRKPQYLGCVVFTREQHQQRKLGRRIACTSSRRQPSRAKWCQHCCPANFGRPRKLSVSIPAQTPSGCTAQLPLRSRSCFGVRCTSCVFCFPL